MSSTPISGGIIRAEIAATASTANTGPCTRGAAHGRVPVEGKDCVMRNGDVLELRFNA